jgi:ribulose-phosphate 3-epimerase
MVEISTSILSVEPENAVKTFYNLEVSHTDYFHIDVMDGKFVKNNTMDKMQEYTNQIKQISNIPVDVHLMVEDVSLYINSYIPFMPDRITFHYEACKNDDDVINDINLIKDNGIKVGIAIKPETNVNKILKFLPIVHMVLVMSVEPGEGGQTLIPETLEKVKELAKYREDNNLDFDIEADGGINLETIQNVKDAGVDIAVVGNGIIKTENFAITIKQLKYGEK